MLDLGANVGCTAEHLLQFALMGSVVAEDMLEVARPRVGLLNIGLEDMKGNETVREVYLGRPRDARGAAEVPA